MTSRFVRLAAQDAAVREGLEQVRGELDVPTGFPPAVEMDALTVAERGPDRSDRRDMRDVPFVTVDPEGSMDLDQAVHLARTPHGYVVHYAIADVAAFAKPGGPIDREARQRGLTLYAPDEKVPLHPPVLSEGAASLLPDRDRPAAVWTLRLDGSGEVTDADVVRAVVRSRAQLTYEQVQHELDSGDARDDTQARLLREVGELRQSRERDRGGVDLPVPEQVVSEEDGEWRLSFRAPLPVERWNAQISLMTGMAAADIMLAAGIGILRTMPPPGEADLARVRRTALALGLPWPRGASYADLIRSADPEQPAHLAFLSLATTLLRGAGYTPFDGSHPELTTHSAVAAPYAHVTAPLRRLVDRFGTEVALAACAGTDVPDWVREALPDLPERMSASGRRARELERESINLIEAVLLADRVGERFPAAVVDREPRDRGFSIVIRDPGVRARATGELSVGTEALVELLTADPERRTVLFTSCDT